MKICDLVSFNKENFYNGAIQTEWYYDSARLESIAKSYVFHGPKYYGVSKDDVLSNEHRLIDTASFAKNITDKLYSDNPDNSFIMTIAGYGTGKSHLAVCLGGLFSGNQKLSDNITDNIADVDYEIGNYIRQKNIRKNLVIVLNGMNNFNLDHEILKCVRITLKENGIDDSILKELTKSYDIARHFVNSTFSIYKEKFENIALDLGVRLKGDALKNYLTLNVESDVNAIKIINAAFKNVTGDTLSWDRGLSAGDILITLQEELCGEGKPFNKILLMFDEFGRYIEYTAANPVVAGDASLQQIFEAIQTSKGKIIFVGFIQSELKAYLSRIEHTANVTRYIDRYRAASENLFLSTNFETILANILKKSPDDFNRVTDNAIEKYSIYHKRIKGALLRWDRNSIKKSVWTNDDMYKNIILKGCYPLHPITTWMLSGSHEWMQQRSTLSFVSEMFEQISQFNIYSDFLPYIYPIQVVDSGIYYEMLNAEEKGLVPSQYCMLYRDIMTKLGDKFNTEELSTLKAILVINITKMSFYDKLDAIKAIGYCSNLKEDEVKGALKSLEEMHGVVSFDNRTNKFDFIAEANGYNEFKRIFFKYLLGTKVTLDDIDDNLMGELNINSIIDTSFGQENHISSTEWSFKTEMLDCSQITCNLLDNYILSVRKVCDGDTPRGTLIYAYCSENSEREIERLSKLYLKYQLDNYPIEIIFLDDSEKNILSSLKIKKALRKFSNSDRERFSTHIDEQKRQEDIKIVRAFRNCVSKRISISKNGTVIYNGRINNLCNNKFKKVYTQPVPFMFDGFENKIKTQANATLISLCSSLFFKTIKNEQIYNSFPAKDKNRISTVLSMSSQYSWKVFNNNCELLEPVNPLMKNIFDDIVKQLDDGEKHKAAEVFYKYVYSPYGMNNKSIAVLISYFMAFQENKYFYCIDGERLSEKHWNDNRGKLKLPDFRRMTIQKNLNFDVDLVGDTCNKIMSNIYVENCDSLEIELQKCIDTEGETEENKYKISQAKAYLNKGNKLYATIYEKIEKADAIIRENSRTFICNNFVKIFKLISPVSGKIAEDSEYVYSNDCILKINKIRSLTDNLMHSKYMDSLHESKCKITEFSQYRSTYLQVANILESNGYKEFSDATKSHINDIESEIKVEQKYSTSITECKKDMALCKNANNYLEYVSYSNKLKSWIDFFENAKDLPKHVSFNLVTGLEKEVKSLDERAENILNECDNTIRKVRYAGSALELQQIDSKLSNLCMFGLDNIYIEKISNIRNSISETLQVINAIPDTLNELEIYLKSIQKDEGMFGYNAIENTIIQRIEKLKEEEIKWVDKNIVNVEKNYSTMSTQDCLSWLEKMRIIPSFCGRNTNDRILKIKPLIETRLQASRVEGVIAMYNMLSESEKDIFKKMIK